MDTNQRPPPRPASQLDAPLTEHDIEDLFEAVLRRPLDNPDYARHLVASRMTVRQLILQMRAGPELRNRIHLEGLPDGPAERRAREFRCPTELQVTMLQPRRLLVVGSCLAHLWTNRIAILPNGCPSELYLFGTELPAEPQHPIGEYDFQIVQLPLRFVLPDGAFAQLKQSDIEGHRALLDHCVNALQVLLASAMAWNKAHGILTFVFGFLAPQQNPMGRLLPRYDLRNPVFFVERLNHALFKQTAVYGNAYFFDVNEVLASHGRRFVQEDMVTQFNHASMMIDFDYQHDSERLDPCRRLSQVYDQRINQTVDAVWHELLGSLRTIRQTDAIKMVVIDLDDTLWRGVAAELDADDLPTSEGWPRGFWEALRFLRRRGLLLGIISQNDESRVVELFGRILGNQLTLDDFTIHRIDWRPKPAKMGEILAAVNLLPTSILYIDDNPVQRAEMAAAFGGLRVLGGDPFTWRHILLWSAETQVARMTPEAGRRTDMVQAQLQRETERAELPRQTFLDSLNVDIKWHEIASTGHPRFARALELINKTNQFNTTGERWSHEACVAAFTAGARFHAFEVTDRFTDYGLVGVLIMEDASIRQFVLSCRVLGLDVERAAIDRIVDHCRDLGRSLVTARMILTDRNLACRQLYPGNAFTWSGDVWQRPI